MNRTYTLRFWGEKVEKMYHICSFLEETDWHWGMTNCSHKIEQRAITGLTGCVSFSQVLQFLCLLIYWERNSGRLPGTEVQEYEGFLRFERDAKIVLAIVVCSSTFLLILALNFVINFYSFHAFLCLNKYKILHNIVLKCFYLHIFLKWFMKHETNLHKSRDMRHNWYFNVSLQVVKVLRK